MTMSLPDSKRQGFFLIEMLIAVGVIIVVIVVGYVLLRSDTPSQSKNSQPTPQSQTENSEQMNELAMYWSRGKCEGTGTVEFGALPMALDDFSIYIPYGLMIDAHVTPIDHGYFEPANRSLGRDVYEVHAIADGYIVEIGERTQSVNGQAQQGEYRIIFEHSCTFYSYVDLVTSLTPEIKTTFDEAKDNSGTAVVRIPVSEGQVIGRIGGQTLDFGVYNADVTLGFISPELYTGEFWKIHTDDPFLYFKEPLKQQLIAKNIRTTEPISGKIDYDQEGKLIGNWFKEGTHGYQGTRQDKYWDGHLAIVPDHIDPRLIIVSIGDFNGETKQFAVGNVDFDPSKIDSSTGFMAIQLNEIEYTDEATGDHLSVDSQMLGKKVKAIASGMYQGMLLIQIHEDGKLEVEAVSKDILFVKEPTSFMGNSVIYER